MHLQYLLSLRYNKSVWIISDTNLLIIAITLIANKNIASKLVIEQVIIDNKTIQ